MVMGRFKKLNNEGSTLVMAIIAIAFVALLATVIMAASFANISMKRMENRSKNTFYTAESVLDEIRAGVGSDSIKVLGDSYEKVMTSMVRQGSEYKYIINNEQANLEFKENFIEEMLGKLSANQLKFDVNESVSSNTPAILNLTKDYLNSFIQGYSASEKTAEVKSIGSIAAIKKNGTLYYTIILHDVVVAYKEEKASENYFSNVTVDLDVTFPNISVDFAGGNKLAGFVEYVLITDKVLSIPGHTVNVNSAHIYSGEGINITSNDDGAGSLNVSGMVVSSDGDTKNPNVVTRNDIVVRGSAKYRSSFTVNGGDIWCSNLTLDSYLGTGGGKSDISAGADVSIDALSNAFLADDLNIYGQNSSATIGGNFYGYKYDGTANNNHATSSAIIISGDASLLRMNVNKLIIGGRSYIDIASHGQDYMTGESLSVKADQDLYLVDSKYLYSNISNPTSKAAWEHVVSDQANPLINDTGAPLTNFSGFFASDLLDSTQPLSIKEVGSYIYIYYNFSSKDATTEYVRRILGGQNAELKAKLNSYFSGVFSNGASSGVSITAGSMYSAGMLMQTSGSVVNNTGSSQSGIIDNVTYANNTGLMDTSVFQLTSTDLDNRFKILRALLVDIPELKNGTKYIVNDQAAALKEFYDNYELADGELDKNAVHNIVDFSLLDTSHPENFYNDEGTLLMYDSGMIKIAIAGDYIVPDEVKGGVIVVNGNVKLNHDFKGLIICTGNLIISNNATVTTDATMVENLIKNEYPFNDGALTEEDKQVENLKFRDYFYAYKQIGTDEDSGEIIKIESLSYKDIIGCNNWRKYDDGK